MTPEPTTSGLVHLYIVRFCKQEIVVFIRLKTYGAGVLGHRSTTDCLKAYGARYQLPVLFSTSDSSSDVLMLSKVRNSVK